MPPINAEYLHDRLPQSRLDLVEAGQFPSEDAVDDYAALVQGLAGRQVRDDRIWSLVIRFQAITRAIDSADSESLRPIAARTRGR
jgi:hypothetical protein